MPAEAERDKIECLNDLTYNLAIKIAKLVTTVV